MTTRTGTHGVQTTPVVALQVLSASGRRPLIFAEGTRMTIGAGADCDLCLRSAELPKLHSVLHLDGQAVWIEAATEETLLSINGETFKRRALRDGDILTFGETSVMVLLGETSVRAAQPVPRPHFDREHLSRFSVNDLCDLIEQEEAGVHSFENGRRNGLKRLLSAVRQTVQPAAASPTIAVKAGRDHQLDELVTHVRELSESLDVRTKELAAQESMLLESTTQLAEAQFRVSRQLEQLLTRLAAEEQKPGELRVSA